MRGGAPIGFPRLPCALLRGKEIGRHSYHAIGSFDLGWVFPLPLARTWRILVLAALPRLKFSNRPTMSQSNHGTAQDAGSLLLLLQKERAAHRQSQRRMAATTLELHALQRQKSDLERRLAEERRSHEYFKSRLKKAKATTSTSKVEPDLVPESIASLTREKEALLDEKNDLLKQQARLTSELEGYAAESKAAISCRVALFSALLDSQKEVEAAKGELRRREAELRAAKEQPRMPDCVVCLDETVNVVFAPCGHACVCTKCGDLSACPLCREAVSSQMKLHFA